jgi:thiamine pyrophosphokinase
VGLPSGALVVAADSGLDLAVAVGLHVDVAVGDFDSVRATTLAELEAGGTATIERHPTDKDATDLELALAAARRHGADHVIVLGGHGGRLDHLLGNALLLAAPDLAGLRVEARMGDALVLVCRPAVAVEVHGAAGDVVSLLAVHGPAEDVHTEGLRYVLRGEQLAPGSTRGVSNELVAATASVRIGAGLLLVVKPGHAA